MAPSTRTRAASVGSIRVAKAKSVAPRPRAFYVMKEAEADLLWALTTVACTGAGMFAEDPGTWYKAFAVLVAAFVPGWFVAGVAFDWAAKRLASPKPFERIQKNKKEEPMYAREAMETAVCMYITACLVTWPVYSALKGQGTFYPTLDAACRADARVYHPEWVCDSWVLTNAVYAFKIAVCLLAADAYTYWKHRSLHHPALYAIHREHHRHHCPSAYASFAVHPVEAFLTFVPVLAMCDSSGYVNLYLPYHLPFMVGLGILNLYLHCGYDIPWVEAMLRPLCLNTSVHHVQHHRLQIGQYAEVLTLWDFWMGTYVGTWSKGKLKEVEEKIRLGGGAQEDEGGFGK